MSLLSRRWHLRADASSLGEVALAAQSAMVREDIYYSSPGKTTADIEGAFSRCTIIADSLREVGLIDGVGKSHNQVLDIGLRINPDFSMDGSAALTSKFGVDVEQLRGVAKLLAAYTHVRLVGIHIHLKSQVLDAQVLGRYYQKSFDLAWRLHKEEGLAIEFINFGGGMGTVYDEMRDRPVDLRVLGKNIQGLVADNERTLKAKLILETGRFVVCKAGTYYTELVDIKESRGVKYLVVKNGMNGFLRPSIAGLLAKVTEGRALGGEEPLYTSEKPYDVFILGRETDEKDQGKEGVKVVGNLCTGLDVVSEKA